MSTKQPVISGKVLLKLLKQMGFTVVRVNGSHHRLKHLDGRITTVPIHKNNDIPKGLLRKILGEDLKMGMEEFSKLVKKKI